MGPAVGFVELIPLLAAGLTAASTGAAAALSADQGGPVASGPQRTPEQEELLAQSLGRLEEGVVEKSPFLQGDLKTAFQTQGFENLRNRLDKIRQNTQSIAGQNTLQASPPGTVVPGAKTPFG